MKTSELTDAALDWAVAKCEGATDFGFDGITSSFKLNGRLKVLATGWALTMSYHPSTNPSQAHPIIERERISLCGGETFAPDWYACYGDITEDSLGEVGPTPLIAAMRCYVAYKLGDEVEIPEELT